MEYFSNETLNVNNLPRFEDVVFSPIHPSYKKVVYLNLAIFFLIFGGILAALIYFEEDFQNQTLIIATVSGFLFLLIVLFIWYSIAIKRRFFAVRERDILYKRGVLSTTTTIMPFNRIQHVALHEGAFPRIFNLAQIQIFTAGGGTSDVKISGLEKEQAERIKALLMQQIQIHL